MRLLLFILLLCSCELHEQTAFTTKRDTSNKVTLSEIDDLFLAVNDDKYFLLKSKVEANPDLVNVVNDSDKSLLMAAVEKKQILTVKLFVDNGADTGFTNKEGLGVFDIVESFEEELRENFELVLEGEDIPLELLSDMSVKLVAEAAQDQQEKVWKLLNIYFDLGVDVNTKNKRGFTLLGVAAFKPLPQTTASLCRHEGVDVNAKIKNKTILFNLKRQMRRRKELAPIYEIIEQCGGTLR